MRIMERKLSKILYDVDQLENKIPNQLEKQRNKDYVRKQAYLQLSCWIFVHKYNLKVFFDNHTYLMDDIINLSNRISLFRGPFEHFSIFN